MSAPVCWIIAGPNGAGKTTFALEYLPSLAGFHQFINADLIAAGLSPLSPERERVAAARLFLREIGRSVANQESFAFETTLAGRGYLRMLRDMKREGWWIELIYLALPSVSFAQDRVRERVAHGGHDIPDDDIERRYFRGLRNLFDEYTEIAERTRCFYNAERSPRMIFEQQQGHRRILEPEVYQHMQEQAAP